MAVATGNSFASRFGVHIAVLIFVTIWTIPTLGILVSSLRVKDQIAPYVADDTRKPYTHAQVADFQQQLWWFISERRLRMDNQFHAAP